MKYGLEKLPDAIAAPEAHSLNSIAISLKRIADVMEARAKREPRSIFEQAFGK